MKLDEEVEGPVPDPWVGAGPVPDPWNPGDPSHPKARLVAGGGGGSSTGKHE